MSDQESLKIIGARLAGLREVMTAIMQGTTPDTGKWVSASTHARTYTELARQYTATTGKHIKVFDLEKIKGWADTVWPSQKSLFETVYAETVMLANVLNQQEQAPIGQIYNLLVSGSNSAWNGAPFTIDLGRCVREYTEPNITRKYGQLDSASIAVLKRAPCVFAYETGPERLSPKFGYIKDVIQRQGQVRIEYEIHEVTPFLTADDLDQMTFELDLGRLELFRTHWAVKEVNLPKELHAKGVTLPMSLTDVPNAVDVSRHIFDVALSFPGEARPLVEKITQELERRLGPNAYFYDMNYVSQLAQPSLDVLLQGVYSRAKLDVVFLSADYQNKDWCGIEFRAIREIIYNRENSRVMFVRVDEGDVDGVFKTDGYVDARKFDPPKIAEFICERLQVALKRNLPNV